MSELLTRSPKQYKRKEKCLQQPMIEKLALYLAKKRLDP